MLRMFGLAGLLLVATSGMQMANADFVGTMIGGHVDIGVGFDGGLEPHIHKHGEEDILLFGGGTVTGDREFATSDLWFGVRAGTVDTEGDEIPHIYRPGGSQWDFMGTAEGNEIWVLPDAEINGRPFVGFSAEELIGFTDVTVTINGITSRNGLGDYTFSVFQLENGPLSNWASSDGANLSERQFTIPAEKHDHWFMAFNSEGLFDVSLNFAARSSGGIEFNSNATFTFAVGESNFQAVPEPTSMALLACCGTMMLGVRRWRKHASAAQETVI